MVTKAEASKASDDAPIVVDAKNTDAKDKAGNRYSSREVRDATLCHDAFVDTAMVVSRGLTSGLQDYSDRAATSASKRRDGAILDALENFALATGKSVEAWSKVPEAATKPLRDSGRTRSSTASILTTLAFPCATLGLAGDDEDDDDD